MNQLEQAMIEGAKIAQKNYMKMTGDWYLSHGPESFLQHTIAINICEKLGFRVYPEASPKKIMKERNVHKGGPPKKNLYQRFDLVVWDKSSNNLRAILEIKRAWTIGPLFADQEKIANFIKKNEYVKLGYLLAYTDGQGEKRKETLSNRLADWETRLDCKLVDNYVDAHSDEEWGWSIGLFRLL